MGLGTLDIVLLVISLLSSAAIGVYHGIKGLNQSSTDYMLGGRAMKSIPLAMSLTVGTVSAITIMGNAGEMYAHGTQLWVMDIGMALGMYFVAKVFIPIFYPLKMVSLYHYIECRFHSKWLRRATVVLTLLGAYLFIGFLLFPPSIFLQSFTGLPTLANIIITGLACSIYSAFGGVKGVVYTDVLQAIIMVIGSIAIVIQGAANVGGLGKAWDIAYHHDRIEFFNFNLDPYQRHSFWLVTIYGFFFSLSTYGVNQSQTQRTFSTTSVREAQRVLYYAIFGMLLLKGCVNLSGVTIFANYVDCDPLTKYSTTKPMNNIIIASTYVLDHLTQIPGLAGLFVASIYAAVLSSVSTQVNSMTALLWEDFFKTIPVFASLSDVIVVRLQKVIVLITGIIGTFLSILVANFSSFLGALFQLTGAIWGPMIGLFLLAVYLPWIKFKGASIGFLAAIGFSLWIVIGQIVTQNDPLNLPLSREGCPIENITETTTLSISNVTIISITTENALNITMMEDSLISNSTEMTRLVVNHGTGFYGISYCLNHCWGALSCIIVALLITAFTGSNKPDELDEKLISPCMWYWFVNGFSKKRLMNHLMGCSNEKESSLSIDSEKKPLDGDQEEAEPLSDATKF